MAISRKHIVTAVSIVWLLALTTVGAYALRSSHVYHLPIADAVSAFAIALPPLAGVALSMVLALNEKLAAKGQVQASRIFQVVVSFFLTYEAALAAIAGTHISPPGNLTCALRDTWERMFSQKNQEVIKRIQDAFQCCGFRSMKDMAWPFPDANHRADACMVRYEERRGSCLEPWREEERKVAIMLLVIPLAVFLWKVAILLSPSSQSAWLPSQIRLTDDGTTQNQRRPRLAIGARDVEDVGEENSIQQEVDRLNNDSRLASHIEGNRAKSAGYLSEHARWRDSDD